MRKSNVETEVMEALKKAELRETPEEIVRRNFAGATVQIMKGDKLIIVMEGGKLKDTLQAKEWYKKQLKKTKVVEINDLEDDEMWGMSYQDAYEQAKKQGYPSRIDEDLVCNICGEPWDSYGINHGDMTEKERGRFLAGKGCPCCEGQK
ncbi:MAG: hypothetical protein ACE5K3_00895 [bacterium]